MQFRSCFGTIPASEQKLKPSGRSVFLPFRLGKTCKKRATKTDIGDVGDVGDTSRALILRNLLKGKNGLENPAYRLVRQFLNVFGF
jgi:hypothetical protein